MEGLVSPERKSLHIVSIKTPPWGSTAQDNATFAKVKRLIRIHGQLEEIVVRHFSLQTYEVIAGRNILKAMHELGYKEILVCNVGQISEPQARMINLIKNHNQFPIDHLKIAACIGVIQEEIPLHTLTSYVPYTAEELQRYYKIINFDWDDFADKVENQVSMFDNEEFYEGR